MARMCGGWGADPVPLGPAVAAPRLLARTIEAVRQWRYTPPTQNGRPVSVWFGVFVRFTLR